MSEAHQNEVEASRFATGTPTAQRTTHRRIHSARRTRRWVASSSVVLSGGIVAAMYIDAANANAVDDTDLDSASVDLAARAVSNDRVNDGLLEPPRLTDMAPTTTTPGSTTTTTTAATTPDAEQGATSSTTSARPGTRSDAS